MVRKSVILLVMLSMAIPAGLSAATVDISRIGSGGAIKAFVGEFTNESGENKVVIAEYKKAMEAALLNRKSVKFAVADSAGGADAVISGVIKKWRYLKDDPINSLAGAGGLMLDAATSENYVEMEIDFTVVDAKTSKTLWKDKVSAYVERPMTPEESIPIIYEKVSRTFLAKCFGKGR